MSLRGLTGLRVIEWATGIAGPYTGKLLADAGADVIKLNPSVAILCGAGQPRAPTSVIPKEASFVI